MELLIENVRLFPCLWNPRHPDYRETGVRDQAWDQIVKKCRNTAIKDVRIARCEWKRLRNNHREALKRAKLGQNKLLPAQITTWKYAKAMQFLEPFMKYSITEDIELEPPPSSPSIYSDAASPTADPGNTKKKENLNKRRCIECLSESSRSYQNDQDSDALESFFECILKSTREMPLWMQTQIKKKMFAIIIEAEEQLSCQVDALPKQDIIILSKIKTENPET